MEVLIERRIEQVRDGSHYKGYVKIADSQFNYELVFAVPIPELDTVEPTEDKDEIHRLFQITVSRNNLRVELTDEEYGFFIKLLLVATVEFYHLPQTRASNEGMMGQMALGGGLMAAFGASLSIAITSNGSYDLPPQTCEMLNDPKFGCSLIV